MVRKNFDLMWIGSNLGKFVNSDLQTGGERALLVGLRAWKEEGMDGDELIRCCNVCAGIFPPILFEGEGEGEDEDEDEENDNNNDLDEDDVEDKKEGEQYFGARASPTIPSFKQNVICAVKIFSAAHLIINENNTNSNENDGAQVYASYQFDGLQQPHATSSKHATSTGYVNFDDENMFTVAGSSSYWNRRLLGNDATQSVGGGSTSNNNDLEEVSERAKLLFYMAASTN